MTRLIAALLAVAALGTTTSSVILAGKGCDAFLWPLATERAWTQADDSETASSGATLASPPERAITLALLPASEAKLVVTPTSTPKPEDAERFGGVVNFDKGLEAGHVQITISAHAWIDVVQNGATLAATGHTGATDCDGLRKSVRFEIGPGPFSLQVSGAPSGTIKIAIRPAAD